MRFSTMSALVATATATLAIVGGTPAGAATAQCPYADMVPTRDTYSGPYRSYQDELTRQRFTAAVVCLTNHERTTRGLKPLATDTTLQGVAFNHSTDMVRRHYFSHINPEGKDAKQRMLEAGYFKQAGCSTPCGYWGENIAWGTGTTYTTPRYRVTSWMNSPGHRANILNPNVTEVGVGVSLSAWNSTANPGITLTQVFGSLG